MVSYLKLLPFYEEFARGFRSHTVILYYIMFRSHTLILFRSHLITLAEAPAISTDADTRIKGVQIGDHKTKQ